ncbi:hypothetical protein R1flu_019476 [Riccia fluitans]|uniref:Uncharacterized protein n=1 Tax=Riccia fluitans TaxID=41844 RepID=A0ABD1ZIY9_9MARC
MNRPTTRSRIRALNFDSVDNDEEDKDEDKEFIDDSEVDKYHFTLAQMVAEMTSPVSELRPLVSPDVPILQPVALASP